MKSTIHELREVIAAWNRGDGGAAEFEAQLVLDFAELFQLMLGLAEFESAYVGSRRVVFNLCWVSQSVVHLILGLAELFLTYVGSRIVVFSLW